MPLQLIALGNSAAAKLDSIYFQNFIINHLFEAKTIKDSTVLNLDNDLVCLPLANFKLTSGFGFRTHPVTGIRNSFHEGIDLRANYEPVYSVLSGIVVAVGYNPFLGNYIKLTNGDYTLIYGHLSHLLVKAGDIVNAARVIGLSGATGRVTGGHLHFAVQYKTNYISPLQFLHQLFTIIPK